MDQYFEILDIIESLMVFSADTSSSSQTEEVGFKLGSQLKGSEVIILNSDLGGGKTTLVRGITRGAGSKNVVASPSFTISRVYKSPKFSINHYDFYRLNSPGLMLYELKDLIKDGNSVVVIEWSDIVENVLPKNKVVVDIKVASENERKISFTYPSYMSYLIKDLK